MIQYFNIRGTMIKKIDIITVLGGSLFKEADGNWRTTSFEDLQHNGAAGMGDNLRVIAGNLLFQTLHRKLPGSVLVSGGRGKNCNDSAKPTVSSIMKKELIALGLPGKFIAEDPHSNSTYAQLLWLSKYMNNKTGIVGIVSNEYHLPRIQAFIDWRPELNLLCDRAALISAEQILTAKDPKKWREKISDAYRTSAMQDIIAREKNGIENIKKGQYKFYV